MKVLLVEESGARRKLLSKVLVASGLNAADVLEAADPASALLLLRADRTVVLVVADWVQKGMDGLGFIKAIRAVPELGAVHVLFCVNRDQRALADEALRLGKSSALLRPFTNSQFGGRVEGMLDEIQPRRNHGITRILRSIRAGAEQAVSLPFMMRLPSEAMQDFLRSGVPSVHDPGEILVKAGTLVKSLHVITLGSAEETDDSAPGRCTIRGDCDCFGEVSLMSGEPSSVTVRAKTRVKVCSLDAASLLAFIRRHPVVNLHLSGLTTRREPARDKSGKQAEFSGNLETMPLAEVVQFLVSARKTGGLDLVHAGEEGKIILSGGRVVHATLGPLAGEPAFMAMMMWAEAGFMFNSAPASGPETITKGTIMLLMEALQVRDQRQAQAAGPAA